MPGPNWSNLSAQAEQAAKEAQGTPGLYLPPNWGQFWKPKRNAARVSRATIAAVGDSVSRGYYASNMNTKGWVGLVSAALQASYGDGGSGFQGVESSVPAMNQLSVPGAVITAYAAQEVATTGTWTVPAAYGPGALTIETVVAGSTATFNVRGSVVSMYWAGFGGLGTFNWTIDGVSQTAVNTASTAVISKTVVSGLSSGNHTVVVTVPGTSGVYLCGASGENATGVVVNQFGKAGATAATFNNTDGYVSSATWNGGPNYPADLVIYALGVNEANTAVSADVWAQNLRRYMDVLRSGASPQTDVLFVLNHIGNYDNATPTYQDQVARARGIAEGYGAGLLDLWTLGRNSYAYWTSLGYWCAPNGTGAAGSDPIHLSDAGHAYVASQVLPVVLAA